MFCQWIFTVSVFVLIKTVHSIHSVVFSKKSRAKFCKKKSHSWAIQFCHDSQSTKKTQIVVQIKEIGNFIFPTKWYFKESKQALTTRSFHTELKKILSYVNVFNWVRPVSNLLLLVHTLLYCLTIEQFLMHTVSTSASLRSAYVSKISL